MTRREGAGAELAWAVGVRWKEGAEVRCGAEWPGRSGRCGQG
jgi:hypothetical protein